MVQALNLPSFDIRLRQAGKSRQVFDGIRKKWVALTPEEWVRQHFIHYLTAYRDCPPGLMAVEMEMQLNNMKKRADIVVHNREGSPLLIVECKAPAVGIAQSAFEQVLHYYTALRPRYVVVSNGLKHYCLQVKTDGSYKLLEEIPRYGEMVAN